MSKPTKQQLLSLINHLAYEPAGLDPRNYGGDNTEGFREDKSRIALQLSDFKKIFIAVNNRDGLTEDHILFALDHSFSGRLSYEEKSKSLTYCTGQYYPTEYRAACCAVLASALWSYMRDLMPADTDNKGQWLRDYFKKELGRGVGTRWFQ
jgi:hypothetical protein